MTISPTAVPTCYQHPGVERVARCMLCGHAICSACILRTPNGVSCPACSGSIRRAKRNETAIPWRGSPAATRRSPRRRQLYAAALALAVLVLGGVVWVVGSQSDGQGWAADRFPLIFKHRLSPEVPVTTSGSYKFIATVGGSPVTYNPCKPVRYELNLLQAPPGAEGVLGVAIQRVEAATGLKFEYVGTTERRPLDKAPRTYGLAPTPPPVVISWATPQDAPALAGDVAGYAGSSYLAGGRARHFVTGQVILDSDVYTRLLQTPGGSEQARAITMHELGHLVGLAHVADDRELMNEMNVGQLDFGPGDRAGLAILGRGDC